MVNNIFYEGFEGEPEIAFVSNDNKLIIWNGYFETILDNLLKNHVPLEGIVKEYYYHEGWYDDSPWLIKDAPLAIEQLKRFDITKIENPSMKDNLGAVVKSIVVFLSTNSSNNIYIEYN